MTVFQYDYPRTDSWINVALVKVSSGTLYLQLLNLKKPKL